MIYALHGAVGHADDWNTLSAGLGDERVSRVDLWRYLMCCPMSLTEFAAAFNKEVMAQMKHQKEKPILLGYSMGGRLALHILLDSPELWGGAVIVSAHTGLQEADRPARLASDAEWAAMSLKGEWQNFLEEWNAQGVLGSDVMPSRYHLEARRQPIARSFMDWSLGQQEDLTRLLEKEEPSCPILWLVGEKDKKFTAVAKEAAARVASVELEIIANVGHRVPWEEPEEFTQSVRAWLDQVRCR